MENKNILLFSVGSLQYSIPFFLEVFFKKISKISKLNLFVSEPVSLKFINEGTEISDYRGSASFSHNYQKYSSSLNIIENIIIKPYDESHVSHVDTGHYFMHAATYKS